MYSDIEEISSFDITAIKYEYNDKKKLYISIKNLLNIIPKKRICFLIDNSGSMAGERLSLVIHALKAIIKSSNDNVEIAIFTFSTNCTKIADFTVMNDANKNNFTTIVSNIRTEGSTNLFSGLECTLSYIKSYENKDNIDTHLLLFTDGEPDNRDKTIYDNYLNRFYSDNSNKCIIDLFGFGNNLSTDILKSIYTYGNGQFRFISDKNMVATIFVNYLADLLSTSIIDMTLTYEIDDTFKMVNLGCIQSKQERNFIIDIQPRSVLGILKFDFRNLLTNKKESIIIESIIDGRPDYIFKYHEMRYMLCNILKNITRNSVSDLDNLYNKYKNYSSESNYIQYLLDDIKSSDPNKGQIQKSLANFNTWGNYYLMSLIQAHENQITINFKDKSIEKYSGTLAKIISSDLDVNFNSIPYVMIADSYGYSSYSYSSTPVSAASFNDRSAGCFSEYCNAKIFRNGTVKSVMLKDLKVGDIIASSLTGLYIEIEYIMKTKYNPKIQLWKLGKLIGTGKHPVNIDNIWYYLKDAPGSEKINHNCQYLYSFAVKEVFLDNTSKNVEYMNIENINCATLGHGFLDKPDDDVISSTFWGKTILEIFRKLDQKSLLINGVLNLGEYDYFLRDVKTSWCNGLFFKGRKYVN
jgi:uncharacterized protein YegL